MTREEAENVASLTFGPKAECVRVSSVDRDSRFVVALGSFRISKGESPVPLLLGHGRDWQSAMDHAMSTENGKMALAENQKVKDLVNKAMQTKGPGEFADIVRDLVISEAKEKGATQEAIDRLNEKFEEAKKKIKESKNDDNSGGSEEGKEGREGSGVGVDNHGAGGEG